MVLAYLMSLFNWLLLGNKTTYQENLSSFFIIIDRSNGKIHEPGTDAFVRLRNRFTIPPAFRSAWKRLQRSTTIKS